ncbi:MAG: hypothetical protein WBA67_06330 [Jannaschia sp.]
MFKIDRNPVMTFPVDIHVPGQDAPETMRIAAKAMSFTDLDAHDVSTREATTEFLRFVIVDLLDVVEEDGTPLDYTTALRDELLDLPWVRSPIVRAYFNALNASHAGN